MPRLALAAAIVLLVAGCIRYPETIRPVGGFELDRYLGTWYEIARLDHGFERNLEQVTATYELREDGKVRVVNRGFDVRDGKWKEAVGKARFVGSSDEAHLKVAFFGPFYASYVVFELDADYRYAFVSGLNRNYLWLLARSPDLAPAVYERFVTQAAAAGYDVEELIRVTH
ncbi:MAG: lipocalin family protein [Pseudomonadota bacterium]